MEKYMELENIESYYEQVVKKKMGTDTVMRLAVGLSLVIVTLIVSIILMVTVADWLFLIVLMMIPFACYMIYYIIKNSRVEYEYTFVLGELRIARIKGRSKRRTITYFDVKNIDDIGRYIDPQTGKRTIDPSKYPELLHAAENDYYLNTYYLIIHDKVRKKPAVILMTPNERTFSLIRPYLSVELKKKFLKMQKEDELIRASINKGAKSVDVPEEKKSEEKKPEEKKPEEKKPEEKKPEEKKSEEKKPEEKKPEEKKPEEKKPEEKKPEEKKPEEKKPEEKKPEEKKSEEKKPEEKKTNTKPAASKPSAPKGKSGGAKKKGKKK